MSVDDRESDSDRLIARLVETAGRGPTASEEAKQRIYARVQAEWRDAIQSEPVRKPAPRPTWSIVDWLPASFARGLAVAASLMIAILAAYVAWTPEPEPAVRLATVAKSIGAASIRDGNGESSRLLGVAGRVVQAGDTLVTSGDGSVSLSLDRGMTLRVNNNSEITLTSRDSVDVRVGTVYFDSGSSTLAGNALTIDTPFGSVEHLGTQYEVRVNEDDLRIRVREGAITFRDGQREFVGEIGQQLLLTGQSEPIQTPISTTGPQWQWVEELATAPTADRQQLMELLVWVARESGRELSFESNVVVSAAETTLLTGVAGLTPAETLQVITSTTNIRYRIQDERLFVY